LAFDLQKRRKTKLSENEIGDINRIEEKIKKDTDGKEF